MKQEVVYTNGVSNYLEVDQKSFESFNKEEKKEILFKAVEDADSNTLSKMMYCFMESEGDMEQYKVVDYNDPFTSNYVFKFKKEI